MFTAVLKSLFLRFSPVYRYTIVGESMSPTLSAGQQVLVNRLTYHFKQPQKGDIVALKRPGGREVFIKRISRVEGKKYFVLGDNKTHSTDSRKFGMLDKKDIIGKIVYYA